MRYEGQSDPKTHPILNILLQMKNKGRSDYTIKLVNTSLKHLTRHADLDNPDQVKQFIAQKETTDAYKEKLVYAYNKYCKYYKIQWEQPIYKAEAKPIRLPTTEQLDILINNAHTKTVKIKLTLSKETGLRPIELCRLKVKDVDLTQKLIYPITAKRGNPRTLKISNHLIPLLKRHITRQNLQPNDEIFRGDATNYGKCYRRYRRILATKLDRPDLNTIRLYDFRHYFATRLYSKTKDILLVKQQLGHKRIDTTLIYTQLVSFNEEEEYTSKISKSINQDKQLIEKGYEYVTERDGNKLFRKRK